MAYKSPLHKLAKQYKIEQSGIPAGTREILEQNGEAHETKKAEAQLAPSDVRDASPGVSRSVRSERTNGIHGLAAAAKIFKGETLGKNYTCVALHNML